MTSDQPGAQQMTLDFANNNLNGKSRWRAAEFRDYGTSRTRVCVTVGMMTTGYDCEDVLNVVLARPIFSPTDFIQIKGRGTRPYTFKHDDGAARRESAKDGFALFDFFANCEFFEEEFDYDKKLSVPKGGADGGGGEEAPPSDSYTSTSPDPMAVVERGSVGLEGMRIDREMYRQRFASQAQEAAAAHPDLGAAVAAEDWTAVEALVEKLLMGRPREFWDLLKLRTIFQTDRTPSLREILQYIFGVTPAIPTREQLGLQAFEKFVAVGTVDATKARDLHHIFLAYLLDGHARRLIESGDFAALRAYDAHLHQRLNSAGAQETRKMVDYLRTEVRLEPFVKVA